MGKIATAVAGFALMMGQAALAQDQAAGSAPSSAAALGGADQSGAVTDQGTTQQGTNQSGRRNGNQHNFFRKINFRDPRVIAASLAGLAILTLGLIIATDSGKSRRPASP